MWIYTVPFFGWKVFEMPLLGFLGFPPFALECWILYHLLGAVLERPKSAGRRITLWLALAFLCALIIHEIDTWTVLRFAELQLRGATDIL